MNKKMRNWLIVSFIALLLITPFEVYAAESYTFYGGEGEVAVAYLDGIAAVYNFDYFKQVGVAGYGGDWVNGGRGYNCASYIHKYYQGLYGIGVTGLGSSTSIPTVYSGSGYFYEVTVPQKGDIVRYNNFTHWAIVVSQTGTTVSTICQNRWDSNTANGNFQATATAYPYDNNVKTNDAAYSFFRYSGAAGSSAFKTAWSDVSANDTSASTNNVTDTDHDVYLEGTVKYTLGTKLDGAGCFLSKTKADVENAEPDTPGNALHVSDPASSFATSPNGYSDTSTYRYTKVFYTAKGTGN
ncbi:MAG: hypothetical protein IJ354_06035 [Clostridia bacterium]|nr:hypothetical protein [Clostridia bacterium]